MAAADPARGATAPRTGASARRAPAWLGPACLIGPALAFLLVFYVVPFAQLVVESLHPTGTARPGTMAAIGTEQGAIVRADNGRYATVKVAADLAAATRSLTAAIADIDVTTASGGPLVAALDEQGRVRVESVTTRRNLLTDELVTVAVGSTIEPTAGFTPKFVRVSELGDQLFVFAADGAARRYVIRDVETAVEMESFDAAPGEPGIVAVERLFGGAALAVADTVGTVRVFFTARTEAAQAADGLAVVAARSFPAVGEVTAIAASPPTMSAWTRVSRANGLGGGSPGRRAPF